MLIPRATTKKILKNHQINHHQNRHAFQAPREHFPRLIISCAMKQTLTNSKELKSYSVFSDIGGIKLEMN